MKLNEQARDQFFQNLIVCYANIKKLGLEYEELGYCKILDFFDDDGKIIQKSSIKKL